jgi:hypothetical protein
MPVKDYRDPCLVGVRWIATCWNAELVSAYLTAPYCKSTRCTVTVTS